MKKRQKRLNPEATTTSGSRAGSAAPGTPGSIAPEESKAPSKKELKKNLASARLAEASSTANANQTLNTIMGGFGGRKKGKQYSWMQTGGGSGANTPRLGGGGTTGAAAGDSATAGNAAKAPEKQQLTQDGKYRLGSWREDSDRGKNVQLKDFVAVLERDGRDRKALQEAYNRLDTSLPASK